MTTRAGHAPLSSDASAWLAALSDPLAQFDAPPRRIARSDLAVVNEAATAHGTLPILARNLRQLAARGVHIINGQDAKQLTEVTCKELDQRLVVLAGQNLLLLHHANRITSAFKCAAMPAQVIKGPVFARRLYQHPHDRNYTDIDILVDPDSIATTGEILSGLGYVQAEGPNRGGSENGEYKWLAPDNDIVLIEIQTNLIHSPNLGTGIRFNHADLIEAGNGDAEDATALLLLAAIHGAAGHQFERLQPAIDVLQAARGVAGPIDRNRLVRMARATGSLAALQSALDLAAGLFHDPAACELANELSPAPWRRLRQCLVSPHVVLRAQSHNAGYDSWRRRVYREIIRRAGKKTIVHDRLTPAAYR